MLITKLLAANFLPKLITIQASMEIAPGSEPQRCIVKRKQDNHHKHTIEKHQGGAYKVGFWKKLNPEQHNTKKVKNKMPKWNGTKR